MTTAVGIAVIVLSVIATVYIDTVKDDSSKSLQQLNQISDQTLQQLVVSQRELDALMLSGIRRSVQPIIDAMNQAFLFSEELHELAMQQPPTFRKQSMVLITQLKQYQELVLQLLENRKNLDWTYPALPFINGSMLSDNQRFETAVSLAIAELHEEEQ